MRRDMPRSGSRPIALGVGRNHLKCHEQSGRAGILMPLGWLIRLRGARPAYSAQRVSRRASLLCVKPGNPTNLMAGALLACYVVQADKLMDKQC